MGGKIPQPIRLEVIRKWLQGYSRDQIAKDTRIGAATVSGIVQQYRQDDANFDLLRGVAVELKDRGTVVEDFAPLFRLKSLLEEKEVQLEISENDNLFPEYKKFEAIIITIEVLCFKHDMPVDQFFERIRDQSSLADNLGISIGAISSYLVHLQRKIENQKEEIRRLQIETKNEVQRQGATMNLLREYQANMPKLRSNMDELDKVTKERDSCQRELEHVRQLYHQKVWEQKEE
jgi:predicted transcriptional regulator